MPRRVRTEAGRRRARARFLDNNAERIRLSLIGAAIVVVAAIVAKLALG